MILMAFRGQFEAQERLSALAEKYNIELTFFHGKGGTVSRGGNPSMYKALISQPPGLKGCFRVTEQGMKRKVVVRANLPPEIMFVWA